MTQEQLQQLKEVIQKAVPSIMELEVGCQLKRKDRNNWIANVLSSPCFVEGELNIEYQPSPDDFWCNVSHTPEQIKDEYIILGRPIRLADVLLALQRNQKPCLVDAIGIFYDLNGNALNIGRAYDLDNDDLSKQSEEMQQFLFDLLV